jgi:hypothetical protein
MKNPEFLKQRIYASLLILGSGILLFRAIRMMLVEHAFHKLDWWVNGKRTHRIINIFKTVPLKTSTTYGCVCI